MSVDLEAIVTREALLFLQDGATTRSVGTKISRSKSTVAYDLKHRLHLIDPVIADRVRNKLQDNREESPYIASTAALKARATKPRR